jgi:hypothetical protein
MHFRVESAVKKGPLAPSGPHLRAHFAKVFCFFSSEKKTFLSFPNGLRLGAVSIASRDCPA